MGLQGNLLREFSSAKLVVGEYEGRCEAENWQEKREPPLVLRRKALARKLFRANEMLSAYWKEIKYHNLGLRQLYPRSKSGQKIRSATTRSNHNY